MNPLTHITYTTQLNGWCFEITSVKAKRCKMGEPYTARIDLNIVDGELHLEGAISTTKITHSDKKEIEAFIKSLGFTEYHSSEFINDERVHKVNKIN